MCTVNKVAVYHTSGALGRAKCTLFHSKNKIR